MDNHIIKKIKNLFNVFFVMWGIIIITFSPVERIPQYKFLLIHEISSLKLGFLFFFIVMINLISMRVENIYFKLFSESLYSLPLLLLFLSTIANMPPTIGCFAYLFLAIIAIAIMEFDDIKRNK